MPIKPENKGRYPANWKQIRAAILERAKHRCEFCGVENYAVGQRVDGRWCQQQGEPANYVSARLQADRLNMGLRNELSQPFTVIVLTIAHLDHTPENNDPENLRALCQRCHLHYDAKHHATNAKRTLEAKRHSNQTILFQ
mgnify:FL=1